MDYRKWWKKLQTDSGPTESIITTTPTSTTSPIPVIKEKITTPMPVFSSTKSTRLPSPSHIRIDVKPDGNGFPQASVAISTESELAIAGVATLILIIFGVSLYVTW